MAIKLASLFIKLGADSAELRTEFKRSKKSAQTWQKDLAVIGDRASTAFKGTTAAVTGITVAFGAIYKSTAPLIDSLGKTADKLGATTEGLQAVRFAGEKAGLAFTTIDTALQRQTRRLAEAAKGMGEARGAIAELGLDAAQLASFKPEVALQKILAELEKIPAQSDKVRLAFKIFDTEGVGLVNLTSDALTQARLDIDAVGFSLSRIDVAKVEAANDAFANIGLVTRGLKQSITVSIAEPLAIVAQQLFESAKQAGGFQVNMDRLVLSSLKGVSALAGGAGRLLTFIDGKPEIAAGGLIGYLFGGKLGFLAGAAVASTAEYVKTTFDYYKGIFDDSLSSVDKTILAYDKLQSQIEFLETPGIGNLVGNKNTLLEKLKAQRTEVEFLLVDYGEYDRIGSNAVSNVTGLVGELGKGLLAVSDATKVAAEQFGALENTPIKAPTIDPVELITVQPETGVTAESGEIAALRSEYQIYQDSRVEAARLANQTINDDMRSFFSQQSAANEQFQITWTDFNKASTADRLKIGVQEFGSALDTLGTFSKTWFKINKAVGLANAVVNIAEGITAAFKLPPPASFIAAAKTALVGAAQIVKIKSAQFGGAASAPSVPTSTGILTASPSATTTTQVDQPEPQQNVTVHVYPALGASQDQIDQSINEAVARNVRDGYMIPEYEVVFN
ncbi:hypothetical protein [uncultured Paraglaciecola sp.]|uniref:hypothetical protein n=1 Tax=uncultured Paraglaciecola sp. TaxID=1765024 RepID=UPI00261DBF84|nr:hypothetical protein [uncultured Paraglaciecola sp.]